MLFNCDDRTMRLLEHWCSPQFPSAVLRPARTKESNRMLAVIFGVLGALRPAVAAAPFEMAGAHVGSVADAKQQRTSRPIGIFVNLAGRMHDEGAGLDRNRFAWRAHHPAAFETEIDFGRMWMAMIGADLARLPAGDGDVALFDAAKDFLDM